MKSDSVERWIHRCFIINSLAILLPFYLCVPLFAITSVYIFWQKRYEFKQMVQEKPYFPMFIIYSIFIALWRQNYIGAVVSVAFFIFFCYFYFYSRWIRAEIFLKLIHAHIWLSGILGIASIAIYLQYALSHGYGVFYVFKYNNLQTRAEATFFNANYYGLYCLMIVAFILYLLMKVKVRSFRWSYYLVLVINLMAIILTASRWMYPSLMFVIGIFYLMLNLSWLKYIGGLVLAVVMTIVIKPNLLPRVESLAYAFEDRLILWTTGWNLFHWRPWFGTGAMTYMSYYYLFSDNGNMHAHNVLIDLLANYGFIGCMLLILATYQTVKPIYRLLHQRSCRLEMVYLLTVVAAILFHGIMDVAILWVQTGYIALMVFCLPTQVWQQVAAIKLETLESAQKYLLLCRNDF